MLSDLDLWRAAQVMIKGYGDGATKGRLIIGASTQRQMVKHLSPADQLEMIQLAKADKKHALQVWRIVKAEIGIK